MNTEGETIIEEYLMLVREKLPEAIAEDVISELRLYMNEAATDLGDGTITVQSAKKVVAQFGAPGEVAAEYIQSMLPESLEQEVVSPDVIKEVQQSSQLIEPSLTPMDRNEPTVSHFSFFLIATFQTWLWIIIASVLTLLIGPIGIPIWTIFIPISQAAIVTTVLVVHTLNLQRNKTILWRRAYREWSALQNFVTLPENAIPDLGINVRRLDVVLSFLGLLLYLSTILRGSYPWFIILCATPICILFGGRMYYRITSFSENKDPIRNSRKQFAINLALLVLLNSTAFWMFNFPFYYYNWFNQIAPLLFIYMICMGSILVIDIVTGTQNLWWKIHDTESANAKSGVMSNQEKQELMAQLGKNMKSLYARMVFWIAIFTLPQIYLSSGIPAFDYWSYNSHNSIIFLIVEIIAIAVPLSLYYLYRSFAIKRLESNAVFGQRTRGEAAGDLTISAILLASLLLWMLTTGLISNIVDMFYTYEQQIGSQWSYTLVIMQLIPFPLITIGLFLRVVGDLYELQRKWKQTAVSLIEESGVFLLLALTLYASSEYLRFVSLQPWYPTFLYQYALVYSIIALLAFQIASSSLKGRILKRKEQERMRNKARQIFDSIAN